MDVHRGTAREEVSESDSAHFLRDRVHELGREVATLHGELNEAQARAANAYDRAERAEERVRVLEGALRWALNAVDIYADEAGEGHEDDSDEYKSARAALAAEGPPPPLESAIEAAYGVKYARPAPAAPRCTCFTAGYQAPIVPGLHAPDCPARKDAP